MLLLNSKNPTLTHKTYNNYFCQKINKKIKLTQFTFNYVWLSKSKLSKVTAITVIETGMKSS